MFRLILGLLFTCISISTFAQDVKWLASGGGHNDQIVNSTAFTTNNAIFICGDRAPQNDCIFGNDTIMYDVTGYAAIKPFIVKCDTLGNWKWVRTGGGGYANTGNAAVADENDNVYITGTVDGNAVFDNIYLDNMAYLQAPAYVAKYNTNGVIKWIKRFGERAASQYLPEGEGSVITYNKGNVYAVGKLWEDAIIYGNWILPWQPGSGYVQYFIKFDKLGNFQWVKHIGEGVYASIIFDKKLITDKNGDMLLTGTFKQFMKFADDSVPMESWYHHSYITKLDTNGNVLWSNRFSKNNWEVQILDMITDDSNNIYVSGIFKDTLDLGPNFIAVNSDSGKYDGFVAKLDSAMNTKWMKIIGSQGNQYCRAMALMKDTLYVTGYFDNKLTIDGVSNISAGLTDIFLVSLSADSGKLQERYVMGDVNAETSNGIHCMPGGNIIITGNYIDHTTLGSSHATAIDNYGKEVFIINFDKYHNYYSISENSPTLKNFKLYPNPASNYISVESSDFDLNKNYSITISDIQGQQLFQQSLDNSNITLDISGLSRGIYFLKFNSVDGFAVKKFVKE
jgi:hypothetical protein